MPNNTLLDVLLELRDITDGAETATTSETGVAFAVRYAGSCSVMVHVTAIDNASANETYEMAAEVSDAQGGTYTEVGRIVLDRDTAVPFTAMIPIHSEKAQLLDADADWIRVTATLGGTTPSITYGAYVVPTPMGNPGRVQDRS